MHKQGIVFFDLDDTLVRSSEFQEDAFSYALKEVIARGFNKIPFQTLLDNYKRIYNEDKNGQDHYNKLFRIYCDNEKEVMKWVSVAVTSRHEFKKKEYKNYLRPGALKTLESLKRLRYDIGIITEGVKDKQLEKIALLGMKKYVSRHIWVTLEKSIFFYKRIHTQYSQKYPELWMVGDREDKDITPALNVGFYAVRLDKGKHSSKAQDKNTNFVIQELTWIFQVLEMKRGNGTIHSQ